MAFERADADAKNGSGDVRRNNELLYAPPPRWGLRGRMFGYIFCLVVRKRCRGLGLQLYSDERSRGQYVGVGYIVVESHNRNL